MLAVSEDTPPDMLAGAMDLRVVLPNGNSVKMSVARSTPMMDLLVQVTTLNKLSPASHVLQAIGERGLLPYKPSTPIGALDTWTIHVVSKNKVAPVAVQKKAPLKPANQQQPFEQTFRLQVHLPRNQLYVMRVSSRTRLSDILQQTCSEKNLDASKYEMRNPANLSELLSPSCTLADYGLQEVTVVARSSRAPGMGAALSSSDIMALQREEEKRRQQARQQPGLALVFNKRSRSSVCEGSVSSDSLGGRSISPARSDESASRSASPPAPSLPPMMNPPARPARKRRPAPKPPGPPDGPSTKQSTDAAVSHSRNSSDSSGYHEASVLSDSPAEAQQMPDTLPRRGKVSARSTNPGGLSRSMSSLTSCQHSTSNTSLASSTGHGQKKKKAPPPPPGIAATKDDHLNKTTSLERHLSGKSTNQPHDKCSTLPGKMKMSQHEYARKTPSPEVKIPEESRVPLLSEESPRTSVVKERKTPSPEMQVIEEVRVPSPIDLQERRVSEESIDIANTQNDTKETRVPQSADVPVQKKAPSPEPHVVDKSKVPLASIQKESVIPERKPPSPEIRLSEEVRLPSPTDVHFQRMSEKSETVRKPELPIANLPPSSIHSTEVKLPPPKQPEKRLEEPYLPPAPVETAPEPPIEFAVASDSSASDTEDAVDQVEEAFRSVTAELEAVIKQEEDLNILPPPPLPEDDPAVDWEYQLPAPPSAFRDADSPTLTEGETVVLADTQVFKEPENVDVHLNQAVYRNEVTRVNPLFIPQDYDDNPPSKKMEFSRTRQTSNGEVQHNKHKNESNNRHSRHLSDEENSREVVGQLKEQQHSVVASRDVKQLKNKIHPRKEQNNETNRNNVEVRVREEPKQYNGLSARSNELSNFTITTYQRPRLMSDEIFNEGSDEEKHNSFQKSTKLYLHQKFGSTSAINNTSANLSRTNSFNEEEVKPPASVKRSTSYISLITNPVVRTGRSNIVPNRTKSVGNLATEDQAEKTEEQKELQNLQEQFLQLQKQLVQNPELLESQAPADAPLQSLQVLRTILPQLNQQQNRTTAPPKSLDEELFKQPPTPAMKPSESKPIKETTNSDKQTSVVTVNNEKRYAYRGPPAVNFTTWSERPKSQVSIKMDGDYRIGVGQGGTSEQKDKPAELGKEVIINKPSPAPLTMHLVSHSAAPTVRKPAATVVQKFEEAKAKEPKAASTIGFRTPQHSDPSRVPIVRAVELKKSFIQQQNLHKSTTVLNGDGHVDQRNGDDETFAGVNSLAKRFSYAAPSSNSSRPTRPVSSYSKVENQGNSMGIKSVSSTNLNVNTNHDTKSRRYTSVVGIGSDSDHSLSSTSFREPRGPSVVRVNGFTAPKQLMPVVKGFQFAAPAANRDNQPQRSDSMSGIRPRKTEQNHSEESKSEPPPPPPLAASMRKSTARPRPKTLPAAMSNPRDQLMDAIRNFGGREKLRQVCRTQDNVVLIR